MKKFSLGLIVGLIVGVLLVGVATAATNIKLIINGQEIEMDVQPQIVDGRVLVPARFVAEPLGATVEWKDNSVIINSANKNNEIDKLSPSIDENKWIDLREISQSHGWLVSGNGFVYKNQTDKDNNTPLFNWKDVSKIIDSSILVPHNVVNQYLTN